jgi:hypothetical protein
MEQDDMPTDYGEVFKQIANNYVSPIQAAAIRDAWEQCKQYGLNEETIHFMDNALDGAGY